MAYKLYLDDIRHPPDSDWVLVRNFNKFVETIKSLGLPYLISFDHDLGQDMADKMVKTGLSKRSSRMAKKSVLSGMDCAKWLVEYCMKTGFKLPNYIVHSFNPVGKANILSLLKNYKEHEDSSDN